MQANALLYGAGSRFSDICAVPLPAPTRTYAPVANQEIVEYVKQQIEEVLNLEIVDEHYALAAKGQEMYGVLTCDSEEHPLLTRAFGLRNSYNKHRSFGLCDGAFVRVCANGMFGGEGLVFVRKHTTNVWPDIRSTVAASLEQCRANFERLIWDQERMQEQPCDIETGFSLLGRMYGNGVTSSTEVNIAFREWKEPRHEEFEERNLWSLYNAVTEGLKKGYGGTMMTRHIKAHEWVRGAARLPAPPVAVAVAA